MSGSKVKPLGDNISPFHEVPGSMASLHYAEVAEEAEDVGSAVPMEDVSPEVRWIKSNIKMRVCKTFVKKDLDSALDNECICKCGHKKIDHKYSPLQFSQDNDWTVEKNTVGIPTNTFGEVEFIGHGENERKYIRVDVNTSMDKMAQLMMDVWGLEKPNLLISVTGGANLFAMKANLKEAFRRGLMKAAKSTGAWIVTGGTNTGVMKHVGEAVRDYGLTTTTGAPVVAIGVAPWGCVHKKHDLISQDNNGLYPAQYRISTDKPKVRKEAYLDPNHTHFILVDNGTEHQFAVEIPFRAKLENAVANMKTDTGKDAVKVPVCLLVAEGGPGTLETVQQAILNSIPIIIVQGSGRAADILATAYEISKESDKEYVDKHGKKTVRTETEFETTDEAKILDMIKEVFGQNNQTKNWQMVKESLVNRDLVTVFNLDPTSTNKASRDIDYAILKALLKANKDQVYDQLKLALAWNRIDIAKSEIFVDDRIWESGSLDDILHSAIMLNRKDFIELFLDNGVSLKDFLTLQRLVQLYNQIPPKCQLAMVLRKIKQKYNTDEVKSVSLSDVGHLIQDLIGDFYASHHLTSIDVSRGVRLMMANNTSAKDPYKFNPVQELFFWSVLMNRQELAKVFWKEGKDSIAGALVAYGLLKQMAMRTDDTELQKSLMRNAVDFSDLAIEVLNECYETDERKAQNLLIRQLDSWGGATCLLIAVETENKHFISQTACQALLHKIWMGRLSPENGSLKLLCCILCPALMFPMIKYREEENDSGQIQSSYESVEKAKPGREEGQKPTMNRQQTKMSFQAHLQQEEKEQPNKVSVPHKFYYFYTAPVIIFALNVVSYFGFLALFSYMLLVELDENVSYIEIILIVWVFSIFVEEIRQFSNPHFALRMKTKIQDGSTSIKETRYLVTGSSASVKAKFKSYISDNWNRVDVLTIVLFLTALILRFLPYNSTLEAARVVYAINFITFFFRILHIFSVHRELGPKLVMIGNMLYDLSYFMVILMVFVGSYAIASYSILYPNTEVTGDIVLRVLRMSYWNLYGELFLEDLELEEPECTFDKALVTNGLPLCPTKVGRYVTPILMGIYVLFANILLLNLLIAMFSYTIQKIQDRTDQHWNFQRYILIYEYYSKPPLPPPFILISHVFLLIRAGVRRCGCCGCCVCCRSDNQSDLIKRFPNERQLVQWENVIADSFLQRQEEKELELLDKKVQQTHERLDKLLLRMDQAQETHSTAHAPSSFRADAVVKMPPQLDKRLRTMEDQMHAMSESIQWIMKSMQKGNQSAIDPVPDPAKRKQEEQRLLQEKKAQDSKYLKRMVSLQAESQTKSRNVNYPGTSIKKFNVPDDKASWTVSWPQYKPIHYESPEVKARPYWADQINLLDLKQEDREGKVKFNEYDDKCRVNRVSYLGKYKIIDGLPQNPICRTGMVGRGLLGRWGPNHAGDPVVTRWKRDSSGERIQVNGKYQFEFIAIIRSDNKLNSLPGGMVEPGQNVYECLKAEFKEEALGTLMQDETHKSKIRDRLKVMFEEGQLIYQGYADDPRNTDNAWLETSVYHYHDDTGEVLYPFEIRAGETVDAVSWRTASASLTLHAAHAYYIKMVADKLDAAF